MLDQRKDELVKLSNLPKVSSGSAISPEHLSLTPMKQSRIRDRTYTKQSTETSCSTVQCYKSLILSANPIRDEDTFSTNSFPKAKRRNFAYDERLDKCRAAITKNDGLIPLQDLQPRQ